MSSWLWAALGAVLVFLLSLLVPLLQKDLEEGVPWFAAWLVRRAARKLPTEHQRRFEKEWLAELAAIPGVLVFKLRFALVVSLRAHATGRAMLGLPPWWEEILRRLTQAMAEAWRSFAEGSEAAARERAHARSVLAPLLDPLLDALTRLEAKLFGRRAFDRQEDAPVIKVGIGDRDVFVSYSGNDPKVVADTLARLVAKSNSLVADLGGDALGEEATEEHG